MASRTDNSPDQSIGSTDRLSNGGGRWRLNGNGHLADSDSNWDLSDDLGKLKLGDVDGGKELRAQIRTPPKPRGVTTLARFNDANSLDTSSVTSNSPSPHIYERSAHKAHSRGSSTDSSSSQGSNVSTTGHAMMMNQKHSAGLKVSSASEHKERPHSFSGGLSSAELRRLQNVGEAAVDVANSPSQQWQGNHFRDGEPQPSYPSLMNQGNRASPQLQVSPPRADMPNGPLPRRREDIQIDYAVQQRNYNPLPHSQASVPPGAVAPGPHSFAPRPNGVVAGGPYRQAPRGYTQQGLIPSPTSMGYPPPVNNSQQVYDMMLPHDAVVNRVQQPHTMYRSNHHHSPSDPVAMREAATMALLSNNLQGFNPAIFQAPMAPTLPMYPNQYFGAQDMYAAPNVLSAQALVAARLQYGIVPQQPVDVETLSSPDSNGQGPSANNRKLGLYKTELCRSWEEKGACRYGAKCQFAHGEEELRNVQRHPKYKTEICRTFWVSGSCPYGKRCCFIHTELPQQCPPNSDPSAPGHPEGHVRSPSTTSDPNDASSISLLARIKRGQDSTNLNGNVSTPSDISPTSFQQLTSRPATLRVDTSALEKVAINHQNKSAYPSFASNGILMPANDQPAAKSPAPATAGPDLGRRNNFAYGGPGRHKSNSSGSSIRNSFNGDDLELSYSPTSTQPSHSAYSLASPDGSVQTPRANGHSRTGSAGNWGNVGRNTNFTMSAYPRVGGETMPWSTSELTLGSARLNEQTWA